MIAPLTRKARGADASAVAGNATDITQLQTDIAALPTDAEVAASISSANVAQDLTTMATFATQTALATTNATAAAQNAAILALDTAVTQKAAQTTVTALSATVSALPTNANVDAAIATSQASQNSILAGTYGTITSVNAKADQSTTYSKSEVDSAIAAGGGGGGYTDSQIDTFLAAKASATTQTNIIAGTQALAALDVSGTGYVGGSLQAAQFNSPGSVTGQTFGAFGPTSIWSGNNPLTGDLFAQRLRVTGGVLCGSVIQSAPAVGSVLKVHREDVSSAGSFFIPRTQNVLHQVCGFNFTPASATSHLLVDFVGIFKYGAQDGVADGEWWIGLYVGSQNIGHTVWSAGLTRESGSSSPVQGKFVNTSTGAQSIIVKCTQLYSASQDIFFNGSAGNAWVTVTEVAR